MVVALKSDNTVVSEGKKFARDYISLRATGMTFTELMALGDAIIEVKDAIIEGKEAEIIRKDAIIDAKNAIIEGKEAEIIRKDAIIDAKNAEIIRKDAIIDAKDAEISALNTSNTRLIEKFMETFREIRLRMVHGMIKADFSLEKIADILELNMDYVKELAAIETK